MTLSGDEKYRLYIDPRQIRDDLKEELFQAEDRYFYWHLGVNPWALLRAFRLTYFSGGRRVGASTLTMQLVRLLKPLSTKEIPGKIKQIFWSLAIELTHSKNEILEAYMNRAPFGGNVEGFAAASFIYFGKDINKVTREEFQKLLQLPKDPQKTSTTLLAQKAGLPLLKERIALLPFEAPHWVDSLLKKNSLGRDLHSTLDLSLQKEIELKISSYVKARSAFGVRNAMALIVDSATMEVKSYVGSSNYFDPKIQGQFNGIKGLRSPGSTLKPFIYALAMDQGLIHPQSLLKDTATSFGAFDPENFDHEFSGPLSVTDALNKSRNIPAVYLTSLLREPSFYGFLKKIGIEKLREEEFYGHALSLGGVELSMEKLVELYALLANRGQFKTLVSLKEEHTQRGKNYPSYLSPEATYLVLDILSKNFRNDSKIQDSWIKNSLRVSWKTGTSQSYKDAWTLGVVDRYVVAVWMGNFNGEANPQFVGRDLAAPLFFSLVDSLKARLIEQQRQKGQDFAFFKSFPPKGISEVDLCALTGALPGPDCPHRKKSFFIPGKSPIEKCTVHRKLLVNTKTGKRVCSQDFSSKPFIKSFVYEVWPSDLLKIFRLAGVARKAVPSFDESCSLSLSQTLGLAPTIQSPRKGVLYHFGDFDQQSESIPFMAIADGDVSRLSWFVDREFVGTSPTDKALFWKPTMGKHVVRVVDDLGRSDERALQVEIFN